MRELIFWSSLLIVLVSFIFLLDMVAESDKIYHIKEQTQKTKEVHDAPQVPKWHKQIVHCQLSCGACHH